MLLRFLRRRFATPRIDNLYCRKCWSHAVDIRWQTADAAWGVCRECDAVSGAAPTIAMAAARYRREGVCQVQTSVSRWQFMDLQEWLLRRRGKPIRMGRFYQGEEAEWAAEQKATLDPARRR